MRKEPRAFAQTSYRKLHRPGKLLLMLRLTSTIMTYLYHIYTTPNSPSSQLPEHLFHRLSISFYKLLIEAISLHCLSIETLSDGS